MEKPLKKADKKVEIDKLRENELNLDLTEINDLNGIFLEALLSRIFRIVKKNVNSSILNIDKKSKFRDNDEKIYSLFINIIKNYKEASDYYEINKYQIFNVKIKDILSGILSIILSRIDSLEEFACDSAENPISYEKNDIINSYIVAFMEKIEKHSVVEKSVFDEIFETNVFNCLNNDVEAFWTSISEKAFDCFNKAFFDDLFVIFEEIYTNALNELNDLEKRNVLSKYYDLIENEQDILNSIKENQILNISNTMRNEGVRFYEKQIIDGFLLKLLEVFYALEKMLNEVKMDVSSKAPKLVKEEFICDIKNKTLTKEILPTQMFEQFNEKYNVLFESFKEKARSIISYKMSQQVNKKYVIYEIKKAIAENANLANELTETFKKCEEDIQKLNINDSEILKGVYETISIKTESLKENLQFFDEECASKFQADESSQATNDLIEEAFNLWLKNLKYSSNEELFSERILNSIFENETILKFITNQKKLMQNKKNSVLKSVLVFKKEHLLYEISTFEEIINYSVSRLRDEENEHIKVFVKTIDETYEKIIKIINKYGISSIKPLPHEMFNAKEHEVLMAEKQEGFIKGEIIKVMNIGYKQEDSVIVRANVICAC